MIKLKKIGLVLVAIAIMAMPINASSVTVTLTTDCKSKESSALLNSTEKLRTIVSVNGGSAYQVQYSVLAGNTTSTVTNTVKKGFVATGSSITTDCSTNYNYGKLKLYGNSASSSKRNCLASGVLKNQ